MTTQFSLCPAKVHVKHNLAKHNLLSPKPPENTSMKKEDGPGDLKENRRRNLVLIAEHYGERRQKDLANDLAMDASYLSQLLTGKTGMGDKARDYERLLGLPKYWLDEAHAADEPIPFGAAPKQDIQEELAEK